MASSRARTAPASDPADPASPRSQSRRDRIANDIEDAALDLFAARPSAEVSVEEIAGAAGVALRTLYRYFPSKEEIFVAYPRRQARHLANVIRERPASEAPFTAVRHAFEASWEHQQDELERWFAALANCQTFDRIARISLVAMADALTDALAERVGEEPGALWPAMAGGMVAAALDVGTRQWITHRGDITEHRLAALDIAGRGLVRKFPKPPTRRATR
jgi:AcrR family transcriptional regulator